MNCVVPIILLIVVILIALAIALARAPARAPARVDGAARSKLEARIVAILEDITGAKFDQAHPQWLRDESGAILELDGYNEKMHLAIEVQGPGHIKPLPGESYEAYQKRIARDSLKREICARRGITLIAIDYRISMTNMRAYLQSRLFDINLAPRPNDYIYPLTMKPWKRGDP